MGFLSFWGHRQTTNTTVDLHPALELTRQICWAVTRGTLARSSVKIVDVGGEDDDGAGLVEGGDGEARRDPVPAGLRKAAVVGLDDGHGRDGDQDALTPGIFDEECGGLVTPHRLDGGPASKM